MRAHTWVLKSLALKPALCAWPVMISRAESGGRGFQRLAGEEHHRRFQDREGQRQERSRDQGELDGGGAVLLAHKAAREASLHKPANTSSDSVSRCIKHGNRLDCGMMPKY